MILTSFVTSVGNIPSKTKESYNFVSISCYHISYLAYFKVKLGDQDKLGEPYIVCKACVENLEKWTNDILASVKFGIPMVWRKPKKHFNDCYFCLVGKRI